ncbi:MAG: excinuclease ABC subunit A, partial [Salinimicrobium sp.]
PREFLDQDDCHPYLKAASKAVELKAGEEVISIKELSKHSLVKKALEVPVGGITAISGRSGIGKTTLVKEFLIPSIQTGRPINCSSIKFPKEYTGAHYFEPKKLRVHANTLLVSYLNLLKPVTGIFASATGLKASDFSYKTKTSQCPNCKGTGIIETSLDVAANAVEICEVCKGQRYREHILAHKLESKNIAEVLALNILEIKAWLKQFKLPAKTLGFLDELAEIGLGHLSLDQPVRSLSSGERQRLLLLNWLQDREEHTLYILDEPSTGLHYADIDQLYVILQKLSAANDILIIDHNPYLLEKIGVGLVLE